jgi:hypothetical protein
MLVPSAPTTLTLFPFPLCTCTYVSHHMLSAWVNTLSQNNVPKSSIHASGEEKILCDVALKECMVSYDNNIADLKPAISLRLHVPADDDKVGSGNATFRRRAKPKGGQTQTEAQMKSHPQSLSQHQRSLYHRPTHHHLPSYSSLPLQYTSQNPITSLPLPNQRARPLIKTPIRSPPSQSYIQPQPIPSRPKVGRLTRAVMH